MIHQTLRGIDAILPKDDETQTQGSPAMNTSHAGASLMHLRRVSPYLTSGVLQATWPSKAFRKVSFTALFSATNAAAV